MNVTDSSMLVNDAILPEQWSALRRSRDLCGEQRLMLTMLEDAIHCYRAASAFTEGAAKHRWWNRRQRLADQAAAWFAGASAPLSFEAVCDALNIDPDYLRARLGALERLAPLHKPRCRSGARHMRIVAPQRRRRARQRAAV
jgi:hypothetical protein